MAYSISASEDGCCPGTTVLINKLGLMMATIYAAQGVMDYLRDFFIKAIKK